MYWLKRWCGVKQQKKKKVGNFALCWRLIHLKSFWLKITSGDDLKYRPILHRPRQRTASISLRYDSSTQTTLQELVLQSSTAQFSESSSEKPEKWSCSRKSLHEWTEWTDERKESSLSKSDQKLQETEKIQLWSQREPETLQKVRQRAARSKFSSWRRMKEIHRSWRATAKRK